MKRLFFALLMFTSMMYSQDHKFWQETVTDNSAGISYCNSQIRPTDESLGIAMNLDNIAGADTTSPDTILFVFEVMIAEKWITCDTIIWNICTDYQTAYNPTKTYLYPQSDDSSRIFNYRIDPTSINNIYGFNWNYWRVGLIKNDSTRFIQTLYDY